MSTEGSSSSFRARGSFGFVGRLLGACSLALAAACSPAVEPRGDDVTIGLLLPFTGTASATASNLERAAIFAVDRVNAGGGVRGKKVRLMARDTHSQVVRSRQAVHELIGEGAVVLLGPENPEIATEIAPILDAHDVLFLSPLIGASVEPKNECPTPWYRLAPSARSLGEALAKRMQLAGMAEAVVIAAAGDYNEALAAALTRRFTELGGEVLTTVEVDPAAQSYTRAVAAAIEADEDGLDDADAVMLATSPRTAALFINEYSALSERRPHWFLSPLLKTDLLVQNVAPAALEGAEGVAPGVDDPFDEFPAAFSKRWLGDQPLEGAYYYYDAVALTAIALEKAESDPGEMPTYAELEAALVDAAKPPGESAAWDEIELGLRRLRDGQDVYYSGLTGPLLLDQCGSRRSGVTSNFRVENGQIVDEE
jgi:ABC-type branched-subunit amino acid transport system substrate-binding protein